MIENSNINETNDIARDQSEIYQYVDSQANQNNSIEDDKIPDAA